MTVAISAQHKAEQLAHAYQGFKLIIGQGNTGSGHATSKNWRAMVDAHDRWDPIMCEWVNTGDYLWFEDTTPSKAINGLWGKATSGIHRSGPEGKVWKYHPTAFLFQWIEPGNPDYPVEKDTSFLSDMEWPPKDWTIPTPDGHNTYNDNWAVDHNFTYVKVGGSKIKVKTLKILVHDLSLYYENDVEITGEAKEQADQLFKHGIYHKKNPKVKELEQKSMKKVTASFNAVAANMKDIDQIIQKQMNQWAKT